MYLSTIPSYLVSNYSVNLKLAISYLLFKATLLIPRLFADDTCIYASSNNAKKLENDINIELKLIHDWSSANKMYMNPCKSIALILFSNKNKRANMELLINNSQLNVNNACKYLGIIIDNKLDFNIHIQALETKLSRPVGILSKLI